jgi:signal transduction histidine kinase
VAELPHPWRSRSLRARLTMLATAVLAAGLGGGAVLLVVAHTQALVTDLHARAESTAQGVADLVDTGQPLPQPLPIGDGTTVVVQVVDGREQVRGASAGADQLVPLLRPAELARVRDGRTLVLPGDRAGVSGTVHVLGVAAGPAVDRQTVLVAVDASQVGASSRALRAVLLVSFPVLLVLLAALSWYVTGRALRPVEGLRRGAEEISGSDASRRLPVPPGRDEVQRLAVTLNSMLGRLEAAGDRQRAFVADAAHELRSPLASLRTQLEVAQHLGAKARWSRTADGALLDVGRLARLVDDLLLLAQLDERGAAPVLRRTRVDLAGLVAGTVAAAPGGSDGHSDGAGPAPAAGGRRPAEVVVSVDGPAVVDGDPEALRRVLTNLVDNATRHARSRVVVAAARAAGTVTVTVTDDGPGIPPADRDRVFDRFTRLDDARSRDAGGTGLGLPIVRELVLAHGGTVTLDDAGPGLRVAVRIPAGDL